MEFEPKPIVAIFPLQLVLCGRTNKLTIRLRVVTDRVGASEDSSVKRHGSGVQPAVLNQRNHASFEVEYRVIEAQKCPRRTRSIATCAITKLGRTSNSDFVSMCIVFQASALQSLSGVFREGRNGDVPF